MKRNITYFLLLSILGLFGCQLQAQAPIFRHFTAEDGLPGSMVYFTMQDSKGYIWSATDRGVTRFDGHHFKLFTVKDGLPSNEVWGIAEDDQGRLWVNTFSSICYYENGKFKTLDFASLKGYKEKVFHVLNSMGHFIYLLGTDRRVSFLNDQDSLIFFNKEDWAVFPFGFILKENNNTTSYFEKARSRLNIPQGDSLVAIDNAFIIDRDKNITKKLESLSNIMVQFGTSANDTQVAMIISGKIWQLDNTGIRQLDLNHIWGKNKNPHVQIIKKIVQNKIWIQAESKNYFVDTLWQPLHSLDFLRELHFNNILIDKQENIWLSTVNGLHFINKKSQSSKTYNIANKSESIKFLSINAKKEVWGLNTKGLLYKLDSIKGLLSISPKPVVQVPTDLSFAPDGSLWFSGNSLWKIEKQDLEKQPFRDSYQYKPSLSRYIRAVKSIHFDKNNTPFIATYSSILKLALYNQKEGSRLYWGRTYGISSLDNGNLWIAGNKGVTYLSASGEELPIPGNIQQPVFDLPTNNILTGKDQNLWMAVTNRGLYRFDNKQLDSIPELQGILVQSIFMDPDQQLWAASNIGLAKIFNISSNPFSYDFQWFTEIDGLASNDVKDVLYSKGQIYAATNKGLTVLPDQSNKELQDYSPFLFSRLQINRKDTSIQKKYVLNPHQNNLLIEYQCLDYKNMSSKVFQYKLEGVDNQWVETSSFQKEYNLLPPGSYTFRLRRKTDVTTPTSPELQMQFEILQPIWKRTWFVISAVLLITSLIVWFINNKIKEIKKRAEQETELNKKFAELELKALQSQMNPHFIFNALHAIQDFIFKKDERVANRYLVKFSRLIRLVLESSKEKFIILEEEIQLLQLYIELEHLRFQEKFTFEINVEDGLSPSMVEIPSMLLQPFVENAINHGLIHRKDSGKLLLSFSKKGGQLYCQIEDNGIGRKKAREIKERSIKSYKSRGMQLVEERQRMWNIIGSSPISINVTDLLDEDGQGCGTLVEVEVNLGD